VIATPVVLVVPLLVPLSPLIASNAAILQAFNPHPQLEQDSVGPRRDTLLLAGIVVHRPLVELVGRREGNFCLAQAVEGFTIRSNNI